MKLIKAKDLFALLVTVTIICSMCMGIINNYFVLTTPIRIL